MSREDFLLFVSEGVQLNNPTIIILVVMIGVLLLLFVLKRKQSKIKDEVDEIFGQSEW